MTAPTTVALATAPIPLGVTMAGYLQATASDRFTEPHPPLPPQLRATPMVVLTPTATPIIYRGVPILPLYPVILPVTVTATTGPNDIHAVVDTDPVWDPTGGPLGTGGWSTPIPASGVGDYRWSVQTLVDPQSNDDGYYPLGDRSSVDQTTEAIVSTSWDVDPGTPGGPSWHAAVPFKPWVIHREDTKADGSKFNHPKAVSFSMSSDQHLWLDMGVDVPQPFTWVIAAMPTSPADQLHYILDSGRNPYALGFPVLTAAQLGDAYTLPDNLAYRTTLAVAGPGTVVMNTAVTAAGGYGLTINKPLLKNVVPRVYGMVYNGSRSMLWVRGGDMSQVVNGTVATGAAYKHRYYVLGREYGWLSPVSGCEMFIFELRFWKHALTAADMEEQYGQLSSIYSFESYAPQRST